MWWALENPQKRPLLERSRSTSGVERDLENIEPFPGHGLLTGGRQGIPLMTVVGSH